MTDVIESVPMETADDAEIADNSMSQDRTPALSAPAAEEPSDDESDNEPLLAKVAPTKKAVAFSSDASQKRVPKPGLKKKKSVEADSDAAPDAPVKKSSVKSSIKPMPLKSASSQKRRLLTRTKFNLELDVGRVKRAVLHASNVRLGRNASIACTALVESHVTQFVKCAALFCAKDSRLNPIHFRQAVFHNPWLLHPAGKDSFVIPGSGFDQTVSFGMDRFRETSRSSAAQKEHA